MLPTARPLRGGRDEYRAQAEGPKGGNKGVKVCTYRCVYRWGPKSKRIPAWCHPLSERSKIGKPLSWGRVRGGGSRGQGQKV